MSVFLVAMVCSITAGEVIRVDVDANLAEYAGPLWNFTTVGEEAQCEYPADGALIPGDIPPGEPGILYTELIFIPGATAVKHTGYLSKNQDDVANRVEDANLGPPPFAGVPGYEYRYYAGHPGLYPYDSLIRGQVYYWTVDETDPFGNVFPADVWEFTVQDFKAYAPSPPNEATFVSVTPILSWKAGYGAQWHFIYFGTSLDYDPYIFPIIQPPPWSQPVGDEDWDPIADGGLTIESGTTYYWRIDEVQGRFPPSPGTIYRGDVWCFTTVGEEAQCEYPEDGAMIPGDIPPEEPDILYTELIFIPGATAVKHTGYLSKNYDNVANRLEDANLGPPPFAGVPGYEYKYFAGHPGLYPYENLIRGQVYYWTVDETDPFGNVFPADVWEFTVQDYKAFVPNPPNEAIFIDTDVLLSWFPGLGADLHDVYIGTNWEDVNNAVYHPTSPPPEFMSTEKNPNYQCSNLSFNTRYYWRVDEVICAFPRPYCGHYYKGDVWSFTTVGGEAQCEYPADGAVDVSIETNLTWMRGEGAKWDKVYFGTDPCDANLTLVASIPDYLPAEYDPRDPDPGTEPNLLPSTTYYWQIVEVNGPNEYPGPVWSFSTIPGEAQCDYPEDGAMIPGDYYPDFLYTWLIFIPGPTAIQHTGYFSKVRDEVANRAEVAKIPPPMWPPIPHEHKYIVGGPYFPYGNLIRGQVYYWTDDETDSFGNVFLGDVWEFTVQPYEAFLPSPPNEAVFISTDVELSWLAGYGAQEHDVFFGTNWEDVNNAYFRFPVHNSSPEYVDTTDVGVLSYQMNGLDPETRYYWRIDEVQGRFPPSPGTIYRGDVWCFTTVPHRIFVDVDATGAEDGTSWADAYKFLQDALIDANSALKPVEIWVAEGIYTPDSNSADPNGSGDRTATFKLINGVTLEGGYAGFGEANPNGRDIELYETILSGDLRGNDIDVNDPDDLWDEPSRDDNSYHVVGGSDTNTTAVLDGFTITGGNAHGSYPDYCGGGGMYNSSGSPRVTNCTFICNASKGWGGGMFNYHSSPTLANCTFSTNGGGGMDNDFSNPRLTNCTFYNNNWSAMYCNLGSLTLTNCTFTGNLGVRFGGAIFNQHSSCTLTNCILWGDTPDEIYESQGVTVITYSNIKGSWPGEGNIDADPCFIDAAGGDLRLSSDSPCIDTGYNNAPNLPATDMDGHPRIIDGDCNETDVVDMGAYEFNYAYLGDFDYQCDVDLADISIFGLAWMTKPGDAQWNRFCDISKPSDNYIDWRDAAIVCDNWLAEIP